MIDEMRESSSEEVRATPTIEAPAAAKAWVMARPSPLEAPVMRTVLPARELEKFDGEMKEYEVWWTGVNAILKDWWFDLIGRKVGWCGCE